VIGSFLAGALAGYAIAIPVGAVAVLIVELGIRRGFRVGAAAGMGAATADGLYAGLAMAGGTAVAAAIGPFQEPLRIVAAGVLTGVALRGFVSLLLGPRGVSSGTDLPVSALATWLRFTAITLLNPATVVYFAALILGLPSLSDQPGERIAFVLGAFLASASWQLILAGTGAVAHHRLPGRFQIAVSVFGNLLILYFAVGVALGR
jgi:threonine/homoserine/homoserine lactone efflux protein